jgi:hypothetical protein
MLVSVEHNSHHNDTKSCSCVMGAAGGPSLLSLDVTDRGDGPPAAHNIMQVG